MAALGYGTETDTGSIQIFTSLKANGTLLYRPLIGRGGCLAVATQRSGLVQVGPGHPDPVGPNEITNIQESFIIIHFGFIIVFIVFVSKESESGGKDV